MENTEHEKKHNWWVNAIKHALRASNTGRAGGCTEYGAVWISGVFLE